MGLTNQDQDNNLTIKVHFPLRLEDKNLDISFYKLLVWKRTIIKFVKSYSLRIHLFGRTEVIIVGYELFRIKRISQSFNVKFFFALKPGFEHGFL